MGYMRASKFLQMFIIAFLTAGMLASTAYSGEIPARLESITIVKNENPQQDKYKITAGDVLSLSVYSEPDLAQPEIIVRPDGYATISPIGEVYVEGFDIEQLTKIIVSRFKSYLNEPIISLNVKEFNPALVYVFGAVQKPGTYQQITQTSKYYGDSKNPTVKTDLTLSNVISNAGGITVEADLSNITVTNREGIQKKIDLLKFIKDRDVSQNIKLKTGDMVFIPKVNAPMSDEDFKLLTRMALFPATFPVRVVGEVNNAGVFNITGDSPYVDTAIANASGYSLNANKTVLVVYRKSPNDKLSKIFVTPFKHDFVLRPNDLVEVRKRNFMKVVAGADYLSRIISPFSAIPSASNSWADLIKPMRRYIRY